MAALPLSCQQEMLLLNVPIQPICGEYIDLEEQTGAWISGSFLMLLVKRRAITEVLALIRTIRYWIAYMSYSVCLDSIQATDQDKKGSWLSESNINYINVILWQFTVLLDSLSHVDHVTFSHTTLPVHVNTLPLLLSKYPFKAFGYLRKHFGEVCIIKLKAFKNQALT